MNGSEDKKMSLAINQYLKRTEMEGGGGVEISNQCEDDRPKVALIILNMAKKE